MDVELLQSRSLIVTDAGDVPDIEDLGVGEPPRSWSPSWPRDLVQLRQLLAKVEAS